MSDTPLFAVAAAYDAFMGRWSRIAAHEFVAWLDIPPHQRWLDVGCGTGALTSAILALASPSTVRGIDPCEEYVACARATVRDPRCQFVVADARALPEPPARVDAAASGLALNLVPESCAALDEMIRVTRPGGTVAAYVWDFAGEMQMLRRFWDAAVELDTAARELDQAVCFPLCRPDRLRELFEDAGLTAIQVRPLDIAMVFGSFDDYWLPFLSGQGRAPGYVRSLGEDHRSTLRERLKSALAAAPDGSIHLDARAWAVRGTVLNPESPLRRTSRAYA